MPNSVYSGHEYKNSYYEKEVPPMYFHNHYQQSLCSLLILLLLFRLQNVQVKGQYLNCDSIKDLKIIILFLADKKLPILEKTFAFEYILFMCLLNFKSLSIVIPRDSTFLVS